MNAGAAAFLHLRNAGIVTIVAFELRWGVKEDRVARGRFEAVPLFRHHMEQDRFIERLDHPQIFPNERDVVPINRSQVAKTKFLKQHAAVQTSLEAFLELNQEPFGRIA